MTDFTKLREVIRAYQECTDVALLPPILSAILDAALSSTHGVAALLAALDEARSEAASNRTGLQTLADKRDALLAEIERLRAALERIEANAGCRANCRHIEGVTCLRSVARAALEGEAK